MPHLEPERLVLLALGEEALEQHETGHLNACEQCRAEMDSLRNVAGLGRQASRLRALPPPPEHVWQRIRAELAASGRDQPPPAVSLHTDPPPARPDPPTAPDQEKVREPGGTSARTRDKGPRWRVTVAVAAAAAAVGGLLAAGGTALWIRRGETAAGCRAQDARVTLQALPGAPAGAGGYACLRVVDGERRLVVHAEGMPVRDDADYEAWLLDRDEPTVRTEALGVLGKDSELTVPASLDLSRYNIIDISVEPHDGNAAHSGRSILRGTLR
ncbi:anti-sigma factor [Dactylosporangium sp. NPDC000244]|uniref:anti-sigma factor n=1 Tax=Dactylosporangium sp. NPDC000244 TaxID=3154365 RepID=UPI00332270B9